jgi:hypothetical protein
MSGDVSIVIDRGVTDVSELHKWLKDLLGLKPVDLARIRGKLFRKLAEIQLDIPYITFWLLGNEITLYLDDDEYTEFIKVALNMSCEVSDDKTALNSIRPDVTVLDFIRAFSLMDKEYVETEGQARSSAPKEKDPILDKAIVRLWRNELTEIDVGGYIIFFDLDRNFNVFNVDVGKKPFWCTYTLHRYHTLRFAISLFKKYIDPLFNTQANATTRRYYGD